MRFVLLACLMSGFSIFVYGQTVAPTITQAQKTAQKTLKKLLINDTPYLRSVKFDDCRISLKSETSRAFSSPAGPSASLGGSAFPHDESSAAFSSGPDRPVSRGSHSVYEFDLSRLDTSKIIIHPAFRKGLSRLFISDDPTGVMTAKRPNEILSKYNPGIYVIVTKSKSAEKTLGALKALADICSQKEKR